MRFLVLCCVFALSTSAFAGTPSRVPVQGYLTKSDGTAVDGSVQIEFRLYDAASGGTAWFTESQVAIAEDGNFTVYLGSNVPLDLTLFRRGTAHLGVTIMGEAEMSPRLEMGTVPFAAYAQETAAVPPGAVMMFDLDQCPPAWTALDTARGRAIVGVPTNGTRGGTVGTPLADLENRQHTHVVDAPSCTTSSAGVHSHDVSTTATSTGVAGSHNHEWSSYNVATRVWRSYNTAGASIDIINWTALGNDPGMDNVGGGNFPLAKDNNDFGSATGFNHFTSLAGSHAHTVPALSGSTTMTGGHTHTCDPAAAPSQPSTTTQVPYVQLLICRKD